MSTDVQTESCDTTPLVRIETGHMVFAPTPGVAADEGVRAHPADEDGSAPSAVSSPLLIPAPVEADQPNAPDSFLPDTKVETREGAVEEAHAPVACPDVDGPDVDGPDAAPATALPREGLAPPAAHEEQDASRSQSRVRREATLVEQQQQQEAEPAVQPPPSAQQADLDGDTPAAPPAGETVTTPLDLFALELLCLPPSGEGSVVAPAVAVAIPEMPEAFILDDEADGEYDVERDDAGEGAEAAGPADSFFLSCAVVARGVASFLPTEHLVRVFRCVHAACTDAGLYELERRFDDALTLATRPRGSSPVPLQVYTFADCQIWRYTQRDVLGVVLSHDQHGSDGGGVSVIRGTFVGKGVAAYVKFRCDELPVAHVTGLFAVTAAASPAPAPVPAAAAPDPGDDVPPAITTSATTKARAAGGAVPPPSLELPLLLDATIALRNTYALHLSNGVLARPDQSHLLGIATDLSPLALRSEVVVCSLAVRFPAAPRGAAADGLRGHHDDRHGQDAEWTDGAANTMALEIELPVRGNTPWRHAICGAVPVPFIQLAARIVPSQTGASVISRVPLPEQEVRFAVMQEGTSHVLARDLGPMELGTPVAEVRLALRQHPALAMLEDRYSFCFFGTLITAGERGSLATGRSAASVGTSSITGVPPSVPDEGSMTLHNLLPPNHLQFLVNELRNERCTQDRRLGWPADVSFRADKVLTVVICQTAAPGSGGAAGAAADATAAAASAADPTGGAGATRAARNIRQQRQRDQTSRDVLMGIQATYSQAADCCRRGDVQGLTALLRKAGAGGPALLASGLPAVTVNVRSVLGQGLAHVAAQHGRVDVLDVLVQRGICVGWRDSNGQLPIHIAASKGFAECIPPLLRGHGGMATINAQDNGGRTPLVCALQNGFLNTALWLVEQGANSLIADNAGYAAADFACRLLPTLGDLCAAGSVEAVKVLLSASLDDEPPAELSLAEASVWYTESLNHRLTRGRLLLDAEGLWTIGKRRGTVVPNVLRRTALHAAVQSGSVPLVHLLLARFPKLRILAQDHAGDTALHSAARCPDPDCLVTLLTHLERSATISPVAALAVQNASGRTALHEALLHPHGALHVSRILARCQQAPAQYPVERLGGVLVHCLEHGTRLSVCHFVVAHIHRRTSITPALLAAALAALDAPPAAPGTGTIASAGTTASSASGGPGGAGPPPPDPSLQDAFARRFPRKAAAYAKKQGQTGVERRSGSADDIRRPSSESSSDASSEAAGPRGPSADRRNTCAIGAVPPAKKHTHDASDGSLPSLFAIAVQQGCAATLQLLVDFRSDAVLKGGVRWPAEHFGDFDAPTLLRIAFDRRDLALFTLILTLVKDPPAIAAALRAGVPTDRGLVPLQHVLLAAAPPMEWVSLVLQHAPLTSGPSSGGTLSPYASTWDEPTSPTGGSDANDHETIFTRLVASVVNNTAGALRSTRGGKPPVVPPIETTWSRFLTGTPAVGRVRKDGGGAVAGGGGGSRGGAATLPASSSKEYFESAALQALEVLRVVCHHVASGIAAAPTAAAAAAPAALSPQLSTSFSGVYAADRPAVRDRHLFRRQILFAALRCNGHAAAFAVLQPYLGGTHHVRSSDLRSHCSLLTETNYAISASCASQQQQHLLLLGEGGGARPPRTAPPVSRGLATAQSQVSRSLATPATTVPHHHNTNNTSNARITDTPLKNTKNSTTTGPAASVSMPTTPASIAAAFASVFGGSGALADTHAFAADQHRREQQLGALLHYMHVADVGQLLHALARRRYFFAASTLVRASAVNAHHHDVLMPDAGGSHESSTSKSRPHHQRVLDHRAAHLELESGVSVAHIAAEFGACALLKDILKSGQFVPDEPSPRNGWTPLHFAAANGHTSVVELLLRLGVSPRLRATDQQGENLTPLHLAAKHGHLDVALRLLDHGALVDALTAQHRTALHLACFAGHAAVALALIHHSSSTEKVDVFGSTPILLAAERGHGALVLSAITKARKDSLLLSVNSRTGVSMAHYAAWFGAAMPKELLDRLHVVSAQATAAAQAQRQATASAPLVGSGSFPNNTSPPMTRPQTVATDEAAPRRAHGDAGLCRAPADGTAPVPPGAGLGFLLSTCRAAAAPALRSAVVASGVAVHATRPASASPIDTSGTSLGGLATAATSSAGDYRPLWLPRTPPQGQRLCLRTLAAAIVPHIAAPHGVRSPSPLPREEDTSSQQQQAPSSSSSSSSSSAAGSLAILQDLFAVCTAQRAAASDPTLHQELNTTAAACGPDHAATLRTYHDAAPVACTEHHLFQQPDGRAVHPWLPMHYAMANGQNATTAQLLALDPTQASTPDVALDWAKFLDAETFRAAEAHRQVVHGVVFPPMDSGVPIKNSILVEARRVEDDVFPACPPPPPAPQEWYRGYFDNALTGRSIFALVRLREPSPLSPTAIPRHVPATFHEATSRRVVQGLAFFVKHGMVAEIASRLSLLTNINTPVGLHTPHGFAGVPLLTVAAYHGQVAVVKLLLEAGADPNHVSYLPGTPVSLGKGLTALLAAAHVGHLAAATALLEEAKDLNVDAADACGNTAVHYAVARKHFTLVKTLLRCGARIDGVNHAGDTPEDIATALRCRNVMKLIQLWAVTSNMAPTDRQALHPPCATATAYKAWLAETAVFYKRLDTLHTHAAKVSNKEDANSIPTLLYRKLSQRLQTPPARSVESQLVPFWWPEEVHDINLQATFLGDKGLGTLFQFTKILRHLESLVLSSCQVTNEHVMDMCYQIEQHPTLRRIDLSFNRGVSKTGGLRLLALCEANDNIVEVALEGTSVDVALQRTVSWQTEANRKTQSMRCEDPTSAVHSSCKPTVTPARKRMKDIVRSSPPTASASLNVSAAGSRLPSRLSSRPGHGEK